MPTFGLPAGPSRLRILNGSDSKTINKVKVKAKPPGGNAATAEDDQVSIPPGGKKNYGPDGSLPAEYFCVELTWDSPTLGPGEDVCCCSHEDLQGTISLITVILHEAGSITMRVFPESGMPFLCPCEGWIEGE